MWYRDTRYPHEILTLVSQLSVRALVCNYLRLDEWIPINGIRKRGCRDIRYPQVFRLVDGWSMDPRVLGCHSLVSELRYTIT